MSIPFTDKERFTKFLEILPEEDFDYFLCGELYNLRYTSEHFRMLESELMISKSVTSKFTDQDINQKYITFNESLSNLRDFLVTNFEENRPASGYYLPIKELDNNETKIKLYSICEVAEKAYKDFTQSTNDSLSLSTEEKLDNSIIKGNKRINLPHFKATDWGKITIRFFSEQDVYISVAGEESKQSNYQSLGFSNDKDTNNSPNNAWKFFLELSKNNGETRILPKPIPDTVKKEKQQISDLLKKLFKNDTDPFYDSRETQTYKIKIKLTPPVIDSEPIKDSAQEYLNL